MLRCKILNYMKKDFKSAPYLAPLCRVRELCMEDNFLASGDFGQGGYPGQDLDPGDEFDL